MRIRLISPNGITTISRFCIIRTVSHAGIGISKLYQGAIRLRRRERATPERMLAGAYDAEAGRPLEEKRLELPPGSMVYIDARIFHAVEAKPVDSPQLYRIFNIDIFKEAGPPHRYTHKKSLMTGWQRRHRSVRNSLIVRGIRKGVGANLLFLSIDLNRRLGYNFGKNREL